MCGAFLEISKSIYVVVIYTGTDTKLVMNHRSSPHKVSSYMSFPYKLMYCYIVLTLIVAGFQGFKSVEFTLNDYPKMEYLSFGYQKTIGTAV